MLLSEKKSHNKGITLIELIIVLAILGLVIGMAFSLFGFGNKVFKDGSGQYDVQSATRLASHFITEETRFAADIEILSAVPGGYLADHTTIPIYDNYMFYDSGSVKKINSFEVTSKPIATTGTLNFTKETAPYDTALEYILTATEGTRNYSVTNQVYSLNLNLGIQKKIIGLATGQAIKYRTLSDYISGSQAPTVIIDPTNNTNIALELDCSKAIDISSAATRITDQRVPQPSKFGSLSFPNSKTLLISFAQTVQNGRDLNFEITFYEYDGSTSTYAYEIEYSNSTGWAVK